MKDADIKYIVRTEYVGYNDAIENEIIQKVGYSNGSGCGLGIRDHVWYFKTEEEAEICAEKIRKIGYLPVSISSKDR